MFAEVIDSFVRQSPGLLELVAFRALPFMGYLAATSRVSWRGKVLALGCYALLLGATRTCGGNLVVTVLESALGYIYYGLLACCTPWLSRQVRAGNVGNGAVLVLCALFFVVAPPLLVPSSTAAPFHVVGWERMLACYSLTVETARSRRSLPLAESLFFLLVNPTLVYVERGQRVGEPALRLSAVMRVAAGVGTVALALLLLTVAGRLAPPAHLTEASLFGVYLVAMPFAGVRFLAEYGAHAGVASMLIGSMAILGWRVPERYHYPLAARDPADFWRRWNIYVGSWFKRYVFLPVALAHGRRFRGFFQGWAKAAALVATFAAVGLFHDGFTYANSLVLTLEGTSGFLVWALAILLWYVVGKAWGRLGSWLRLGRAGWGYTLSATASRFAVAHVILGVVLLYTARSW